MIPTAELAVLELKKAAARMTMSCGFKPGRFEVEAGISRVFELFDWCQDLDSR